ncbi:bifunctional diguanylate cyclase/phosphodiesterase [Azonexus hydrophilus]|uniref:bifunctional diguanylate cyclase/phosphodiesterase n=1 Tax=Azonexus hydrophilus TaxID=418702 RepID=UPI001964EC87|nr:EAL domain-containing protein [Azonexus hydrophilus]
MSLFRQLWLAVIVSTLIAFVGSFAVSMMTARQYLEEQLAIKNNDNAASLALSMSQMEKDPVTLELQVAALFDSGQYARIQVRDPEGLTLIKKTSPAVSDDVPAWFARLFPIASRPGSAQISTGWTQFGTVELVSHNRFAYRELWQGGWRLLMWFSLGGVLAGFLGMQILRRIKRPLDAVVGQARAISERRFIRIEEPATPELKSLARAMNVMVGRVKAMFEEEASRLEQVRREATLDPLTGLANRAYFMNRLAIALNDEDAPTRGSLIMLRLADLAGINRCAGRETADEVLRRTGAALRELAEKNPGAEAARLNGADFSLLLPGQNDPQPACQQLLAALQSLVAAQLLPENAIGHLGSSVYQHNEPVPQLLARVDAALAAAELQGPLAAQHVAEQSHCSASTQADWRSILTDALKDQRLRLIEFPVADSNGLLLHLECPLRLQAEESGDWINAGSFMPVASRLSMTSELDLAAVKLALDRLASGLPAVAVNLAGASLIVPDFTPRLLSLLQQRRELAGKLWLEVAESGAFQYFDAFLAFSLALRPLGCRLGIEHFGRQFSQIGRLHDIGLDYLKVDGSFIRNIHGDNGNQAFLKGLCNIAHGIGLTVIAEGVNSAEELATLPALGFDGATGPAVSRN